MQIVPPTTSSPALTRHHREGSNRSSQMDPRPGFKIARVCSQWSTNASCCALWNGRRRAPGRRRRCAHPRTRTDRAGGVVSSMRISRKMRTARSRGAPWSRLQARVHFVDAVGARAGRRADVASRSTRSRVAFRRPGSHSGSHGPGLHVRLAVARRPEAQAALPHQRLEQDVGAATRPATAPRNGRGRATADSQPSRVSGPSASASRTARTPASRPAPARRSSCQLGSSPLAARRTEEPGRFRTHLRQQVGRTAER